MKAFIGEIRTFGGREYIKTSDGWKYHGKSDAKSSKKVDASDPVERAKRIGESAWRGWDAVEHRFQDLIHDHPERERELRVIAEGAKTEKEDEILKKIGLHSPDVLYKITEARMKDGPGVTNTNANQAIAKILKMPEHEKVFRNLSELFATDPHEAVNDGYLKKYSDSRVELFLYDVERKYGPAVRRTVVNRVNEQIE